MKKAINLGLAAFLLAVMGIVYYSCDNPAGGDPTYKGIIKGWVYDDSTKAPLPGVKVWADGIPDTLATDAEGMFNYKTISMPRGDFTYYLIFQRGGYNDKSVKALIKSDVEYRIDSVLMKKSVK